VFNIAVFASDWTEGRNCPLPEQPGLRSWRVRTESDGKHRRLGARRAASTGRSMQTTATSSGARRSSRRPCRRDVQWGTATDRSAHLRRSLEQSTHAVYPRPTSGQTINWGAWSALGTSPPVRIPLWADRGIDSGHGGPRRGKASPTVSCMQARWPARCTHSTEEGDILSGFASGGW